MGAPLYDRSPHCRTASHSGILFLLFLTARHHEVEWYPAAGIGGGPPLPCSYCTQNLQKNKGKYFKKMAILYSFFREIALKPIFGAAALS